MFLQQYLDDAKSPLYGPDMGADSGQRRKQAVYHRIAVEHGAVVVSLYVVVGISLERVAQFRIGHGDSSPRLALRHPPKGTPLDDVVQAAAQA